MNRPSPPTLAIPASSMSPAVASPSGNSTTTQTGRPPMWTKSAQRKMSRLYLYTTLPLTKIVELIHSPHPEGAPGKDSANKKLSTLFDKEPRWLHPRSETDMGRRVDQLAYSPTRSLSAQQLPFSRAHSSSDPTPSSNTPVDFKTEGRSPNTLEVPAFNGWAAPSPVGPVYSPNAPRRDSQGVHFSTRSTPETIGDGSALVQFLRRTTVMSSATDQTTGSFSQVLAGYSQPYIETVRRLVKRFTAPMSNPTSISPISEGYIPPQLSWADDVDAPPTYNSRPYPLPSDFLSLDIIIQNQQCFPGAEQHQRRMCMCFARDDICSSPWVTADGLTHDGMRIVTMGMGYTDIAVRDAFENTPLHLLAARAPPQLLSQVLRSDMATSLLNKRNSAGQTFLHVASRDWTRNPRNMVELLQFLYSTGFDIYARDHYGRNVFHILLSEDFPAQHMDALLQRYDIRWYGKKDAFGLVPMIRIEPQPGMMQRSSTQAMVMDPPAFGQPVFDPASTSPMESFTDPMTATESLLLQHVRLAQDNPILEDAEGRNGIHCLAIATLSKKSLLIKQGLQTQGTQDRAPRRGQDPGQELDSGKDRLTLRLNTLAGLLEAGVDPNQYDNQGNTPLMAFAAQLPEDDDYKIGPQILELLLKHGADLHARNRAGETALQVAVRCGRKLAMRTLVNSGANAHTRDAAGRSALDVTDVKVVGSSTDDDTRKYAHYEACRAWLSGVARAVQHPTVLQEWGAVTPA